ncbi:MAG: YkgJ family cysteine cluster protein [Thermoplasmatales archaeon]|nr:YkgJ family cysteine cluster protein [Thermoplasmatales archaeon]
MEIDYSGVDGFTVDCLPGCGLCCLCQPEVLPLERAYFRKNHPKAMVRSRTSPGGFALALKKGRGSCVFLDGRKCGIYENRPTFCRQFPFHFYSGDRISVELDHSCRGVWQGSGADAGIEARALARDSMDRLRSALSQSAPVYGEFREICEDAGIWEDPSLARAQVSDNLGLFTEPSGLASVMAVSMGDARADLSAPPAPAGVDILGEAADAALGSLASNDPFESPVYCGKDNSWNLFTVRGDEVEWSVLDDDGDLHRRRGIPAGEVRIPPLDAAAAGILSGYVATLNSRESFLGSVYYAVDEFGYDEHLANAYLGSMAVSVADLLWRAGLLERALGLSGADLMREAIMFYDMDRLDSPTIGGFA